MFTLEPFHILSSHFSSLLLSVCLSLCLNLINLNLSIIYLPRPSTLPSFSCSRSFSSFQSSAALQCLRMYMPPRILPSNFFSLTHLLLVLPLWQRLLGFSIMLQAVSGCSPAYQATLPSRAGMTRITLPSLRQCIRFMYESWFSGLEQTGPLVAMTGVRFMDSFM